MFFTSCIKEEPLKKSTGTAPNFNQIPTGPGGISQAYSWSAIPDFPGTARDEAVSFSLKEEGYVGLGASYPNYFNDFYKYNPVSNGWTQLASFPDSGRRGAISFVVNDIAYVGLGHGPDNSGSGFGEKNDFWKYDAINDTWVPLNDFAFFGTENATAFVFNSVAYVVLERGEVFEYDPTADAWTAKKELYDQDIDNRASAVAFRLGSRVYYGTGYDENGGGIGGSRLRDFYQYTPSTDSWVEVDSLPGASRTSAVGFALNGLGFVGTGSDFFANHADFYYYQATLNTWIRVADYPGGAGSGLSAFVINKTAYVGLGYLDAGGFLGAESKKFYKVSL